MFDLMFTIVPIFIGVTAVLVFVMVLTGFARHRKMADKMFDLAEREIDTRQQNQARVTLIECAHCGSKVPAGEECPNCGATTD